jgi:triacylglycerol lipase
VFLDLTAASCFDYMEQLSGLLRDPICYGSGVPRGNGEPVLLIPGFFAGDWMMAPMARWLRRLGYSPYHSGIDLNLGCPDEKAQRLQWRVAAIVRDTGTPLTLIGHSLGGVLARWLTISMPSMVARGVGLGAPLRHEWDSVNVRVRPLMRTVASFWQQMTGAAGRCGTAHCDCGFAAALHRSSGSRFVSIYTRNDEVVDWRTCVDGGPSYEVPGRHLGMVVNREVYRVVAGMLARDERSVRRAGIA